MLLHLTEAWAARKAAPSELGILMEKHHIDTKRLLGEIFDDLAK